MHNAGLNCESYFQKFVWKQCGEHVKYIHAKSRIPVNGLSESVLGTLVTAKNCSAQKSTAQAVFYSSYTKKEVEEVVEQLKLVAAKMGSSLKVGQGNCREQSTERKQCAVKQNCGPFRSSLANDERIGGNSVGTMRNAEGCSQTKRTEIHKIAGTQNEEKLKDQYRVRSEGNADGSRSTVDETDGRVSTVMGTNFHVEEEERNE